MKVWVLVDDCDCGTFVRAFASRGAAEWAAVAIMADVWSRYHLGGVPGVDDIAQFGELSDGDEWLSIEECEVES